MKDTILQGLAQAYGNLVRMVADFLPRLVVMLTIILVGLLVAFILKSILRSILRLTRLDRISEQAGASHVLRKAAMPSMTEFLSRSLFWITFLAFILIGVSVLGIAELQEQIARLFELLPQLFVAIVILFVGMLVANFLSRAALLTAVNAGYRTPKLWGGLVRFMIWILAISMALEQVGLARQTVVAAFSIIFSAIMLALAIAFGLGGRDLARTTLEKYFGDKRREKEHEKEEPSPL
jgi:Mechanosensitive ion channel, conserved TM helix